MYRLNQENAKPWGLSISTTGRVLDLHVVDPGFNPIPHASAEYDPKQKQIQKMPCLIGIHSEGMTLYFFLFSSVQHTLLGGTTQQCSEGAPDSMLGVKLVLGI